MLRKARIMLLTLAAFLVAVSVQAQITTSSMGGKVVDDANEPVIGATVQAVHEPSGTLYGAITNVDGRYAIQGMRTGGPYTVTISYIGYATRTYKDITLQLGEIFNLNVEISESAEMLGEVVVTGTASKFAQEKTGATTNINNATIRELPTVYGFCWWRWPFYQLHRGWRQLQQQLRLEFSPAWWWLSYLCGCHRGNAGGGNSFRRSSE